MPLMPCHAFDPALAIADGRLPDLFNMIEIFERIDEVTPYTGVFL